MLKLWNAFIRFFNTGSFKEFVYEDEEVEPIRIINDAIIIKTKPEKSSIIYSENKEATDVISNLASSKNPISLDNGRSVYKSRDIDNIYVDINDGHLFDLSKSVSVLSPFEYRMDTFIKLIDTINRDISVNYSVEIINTDSGDCMDSFQFYDIEHALFFIRNLEDLIYQLSDGNVFENTSINDMDITLTGLNAVKFITLDVETFDARFNGSFKRNENPVLFNLLLKSGDSMFSNFVVEDGEFRGELFEGTFVINLLESIEIGKIVETKHVSSVTKYKQHNKGENKNAKKI